MSDYPPRSFPESMSRAELQRDNDRLRDLVEKFQSGGKTLLGNEHNEIDKVHS